MATLRFIGPKSGYIPRATGQVVAFARDQSQFPINKYCQYVPTKKEIGVYTVIERDAFVRVPYDAMLAIEDGDAWPLGLDNNVRFTTKTFTCQTRARAWTLGYKTIDMAELFEPKLVHTRASATQMLTNRTQRVVTLLETASNWGGNTSTVNALNGNSGTWAAASDDPSSSHYQAIWKSLIKAAQNIHLACNGQMNINDLRVVVSPGLAIAAATAPEMTNYLRQSPVAMQVLKDGLSDDQALWGLPPQYKGFKFVVEGSPIVTEFPAESATDTTEATTNRLYCKSDTSAAIVSRPGGLDSEVGGPNFSTVQLYHYGELLKVKMQDEPYNERVTGAVSEDFKEVLAAPASGWLITGL